ncbi:MAG: DUF4870 domain-containing protein [Pyrinomonadaceae bacterium]
MPKKKFDTNPLDPTFPERMKEAETNRLSKNDFKTAEFPPPSVTEDETRRFDEANFNAYGSPYNGQQIPVNFKGAKFAEMNESSSRKVAKIGLPENVLTAVPYIPAFFGGVAGLIILFLVPRSEAKVRFHAAQALAAHIAIFLVSLILGGISKIPGMGMAGTANDIFQIVTAVMLIIFAIKAWQGKPIHIESVDSLTEWLEEKINPRN